MPRDVRAVLLAVAVGAPSTSCGTNDTPDQAVGGTAGVTSGSGGIGAAAGFPPTGGAPGGAGLGGGRAGSGNPQGGTGGSGGAPSAGSSPSGAAGIGGGAGEAGQGGGVGGTAGGGTAGAGQSGSTSAGMGGGTSGGGVTFDPPEAVYSVALSVNPSGATKTLALRNGGSAAVTVSDLTVSGTDASRFVTDGAPALPATIAAGAVLSLTLRFAPPSNSATATFTANLTAMLTGGNTAAAGLYGLAMSTSNAEATFDQVVKTLGYAVNVGGTSLTLGTEAAAIGEEVLLTRFRKATASAPVRLVPVARYSPFEAAPYGYYTGQAPNVTRHPLGTMSLGPEDNVANRTLYPPLDQGAMLMFDPGTEPFGIFAESQSNAASLGSDARFYQEDSLNNDQGSVVPVHRVRIYPLRNRAGETIPNAFLLGCEEASNSDYQDYVFVIENVTAA